MSQIVSVIPQTVSIIAQIIMKYMQGSSQDTASVKCMIQEEIRKNQNMENSAAMEKMVDKILDVKHAQELHETALKAERYKLEVEHLKKLVEDLSREEKSVETKEKENMALILSCLVELLLQQQETGHTQKYQKFHKRANCSGMSTTPAQHGRGNHGKFHNRNMNSKESYDQNLTQYQNLQRNTDIQQNNNYQHTLYFRKSPRFQRTSHAQKSTRFQNPHIREKPTAEQESAFQENQSVQRPRGKQSFGCRGRGQRGRGQQPSSVGWNKTRSESQANDLPSKEQPSHFHSQVRKVAGNENSSFITDTFFHQGAKQYVPDHGHGHAGADPADHFGSGYLQFLLNNKQLIIFILFVFVCIIQCTDK